MNIVFKLALVVVSAFSLSFSHEDVLKAYEAYAKAQAITAEADALELASEALESESQALGLTAESLNESSQIEITLVETPDEAKAIFAQAAKEALEKSAKSEAPRKVKKQARKEKESTPKVSARLAHARELLGSSFKGSLPEKAASVESVHKFVRETVKTKLTDKKWKKKATQVSRAIIKEAEKRGFDPIFVMAVIQTESNFNPNVIGGVGEIGLMQIKPDTAEWIASKENIPWKGPQSLKNPMVNIRIGVAYMAFLRKNFDGLASRYVAAYNIGPNKMRSLAAQSRRPKVYPTKVMANYNTIYTELLKLHTAQL